MNYLQSGLHQDKYRTLAVKNLQIWSLTLDPIQSSAIWTYELLPTYAHLLVKGITVTSEKPCYNYLRRCFTDFEQPNTCWESATYFFIVLIKQAPIVHRIIYSYLKSVT